MQKARGEECTGHRPGTPGIGTSKLHSIAASRVHLSSRSLSQQIQYGFGRTPEYCRDGRILEQAAHQTLSLDLLVLWGVGSFNSLDKANDTIRNVLHVVIANLDSRGNIVQ
jgi:hypothetical protein